jgi:hypothetical protein
MTCPQLSETLADYLAGTLAPADAGAIQQHLAECSRCGAEVASLAAAWQDLALLDDEQPSEALRTSFYRRLREYEAVAARPSLGQRLASTLAAFWPRQPLWQLAAVLGALGLGFWLGGRTPAVAPVASAPARVAPQTLAAAPATLPEAPSPLPAAAIDGSEVRALREEVRSLGHLVALSLLRNESATDRLQGVSFSRHSAAYDPRVADALLEAANHDANDNVRLAAIDALAPLLARPPLRERLLAGFAAQRSPLVQIAMVDAVATSAGERAAPALRPLLSAPRLAPAVRQRLEAALGIRS